MKRKFAAFVISILAVVGLFALPAAAQVDFYKQQGFIFQYNPCRITYEQGHSSANGGYITSWLRNVYNYTPVCWVQMKVSYWTWDGVWHVWSSAWIGATPENGYFPMVDFQFGPAPAVWWTDYNTNWGGNIQGIRIYGNGCNASGC